MVSWHREYSISFILSSLFFDGHTTVVGQTTVTLGLGTAMTTSFLLMKVSLGLLFSLAVDVMMLFSFGELISIAIAEVLTALKIIWLGARLLCWTCC
ncbi:membrane protein [Leptolyngbya sp. Heron Island J]|uniref:hypothetical protein n=1 Tax=Leptolyngbya sp. Heron Island J TaxID=1385935 RepID=UPI0003B9D8BC|nr:hypothetical protein [Leptolyngbya sp. Heron Island J]ESA33686.1 membrane protein [Leptolyngbya sp. Heron Island J]